ncbi:MAG TPA: hypothetical protein VK625_03970, partial [Flavitalea sp.]|nr:hypothetical protein [Flavitalea sp.]
MNKCFIFISMVTACSSFAVAQSTKVNTFSNPPAIAAITEKDLQTDLYEMAGDHFRGREAGTLDELAASVWWADKMRAAGLKPAGDDGTYFQFFNLKRNRISLSSKISIGDRAFQLWKDVLVAQTAPASLSVPIIYAGTATKDTLDKLDLKGKAVAVLVSPKEINLNVSLPERRYPGYVLRKYRSDLIQRGAAAIIFIADEMGEKSWIQV